MTLAPAPMTDVGEASPWLAVCTMRQLIPERGVAVLVGETQVALFRIRSATDDYVHAVGHRDPFADANVVARGIVGSVGDRDTVASPMFKHVFDLTTGECLSDPAVRLPVHRTWVAGGVVYVEDEPRAVAAPAVVPVGPEAVVAG
jgi:nitrite reductase (NADH) small subunit